MDFTTKTVGTGQVIQMEISMTPVLKVKKLVPHAVTPSKAHTGDLGYDLVSSRTVQIPPHGVRLIPTGVSVQFPPGYGGLIRDRSSVSVQRSLFVVAGVIDNGYTGEILVALHNDGLTEQEVASGTKIAQLIPLEITNFSVEEVTDLESQDGRGEKGFGSSGT